MSEAAFDLSVVIVTYNNQEDIAACLQALANEAGRVRTQLTLIDNRSQDGTTAIIREKVRDLCNEFAEFTFIENNANMGFTRALNQGLARARGRFVLILNPDTEIQAGCLQKLFPVLASEQRIGALAPQLLNEDGTVQPSCRRFPRRRDIFYEMICLSRLLKSSAEFNSWKMGDFDHRHARRVDQPQGAFLLTREDVLQTVGLWDEQFPMFFSDVDWCRRVYARGYEIYFKPEAKVIHKQGVSIFQRRPQMIWSSHRSFYRYFKKHGNKQTRYGIDEIAGALLLFTALARMAWACSLGRVFSK